MLLEGPRVLHSPVATQDIESYEGRDKNLRFCWEQEYADQVGDSKSSYFYRPEKIGYSVPLVLMKV